MAERPTDTYWNSYSSFAGKSNKFELLDFDKAQRNQNQDENQILLEQIRIDNNVQQGVLEGKARPNAKQVPINNNKNKVKEQSARSMGDNDSLESFSEADQCSPSNSLLCFSLAHDQTSETPSECILDTNHISSIPIVPSCMENDNQNCYTSNDHSTSCCKDVQLKDQKLFSPVIVNGESVTALVKVSSLCGYQILYKQLEGMGKKNDMPALHRKGNKQIKEQSSNKTEVDDSLSTSSEDSPSNSPVLHLKRTYDQISGSPSEYDPSRKTQSEVQSCVESNDPTGNTLSDFNIKAQQKEQKLVCPLHAVSSNVANQQKGLSNESNDGSAVSVSQFPGERHISLLYKKKHSASYNQVLDDDSHPQQALTTSNSLMNREDCNDSSHSYQGSTASECLNFAKPLSSIKCDPDSKSPKINNRHMVQSFIKNNQSCHNSNTNCCKDMQLEMQEFVHAPEQFKKLCNQSNRLTASHYGQQILSKQQEGVVNKNAKPMLNEKVNEYQSSQKTKVKDSEIDDSNDLHLKETHDQTLSEYNPNSKSYLEANEEQNHVENDDQSHCTSYKSGTDCCTKMQEPTCLHLAISLNVAEQQFNYKLAFSPSQFSEECHVSLQHTRLHLQAQSLITSFSINRGSKNDSKPIHGDSPVYDETHSTLTKSIYEHCLFQEVENTQSYPQDIYTCSHKWNSDFQSNGFCHKVQKTLTKQMLRSQGLSSHVKKKLTHKLSAYRGQEKGHDDIPGPAIKPSKMLKQSTMRNKTTLLRCSYHHEQLRYRTNSASGPTKSSAGVSIIVLGYKKTFKLYSITGQHNNEGIGKKYLKEYCNSNLVPVNGMCLYGCIFKLKLGVVEITVTLTAIVMMNRAEMKCTWLIVFIQVALTLLFDMVQLNAIEFSCVIKTACQSIGNAVCQQILYASTQQEKVVSSDNHHLVADVIDKCDHMMSTHSFDSSDFNFSGTESTSNIKPSNKLILRKKLRKKKNVTPACKQIYLLRQRTESVRGHKKKPKLSSNSEESIAQKKSLYTHRCSWQRLTLTKYVNHEKLESRRHAAGELTYESNSNSSSSYCSTSSVTADNVVFTNDTYSYKFFSTEKCDLEFLTENWSTCFTVISSSEIKSIKQLWRAEKISVIYIKVTVSFVHKILKYISVPKRRHSGLSLLRAPGKRKVKLESSVASTSKSTHQIIVHGSFSKNLLNCLQLMKTATDDFVGIPSEKKLSHSQRTNASLDHLSDHQDSSSLQSLLESSSISTSIQSMTIPLNTDAKSLQQTEKMISPIKSKGSKQDVYNPTREQYDCENVVQVPSGAVRVQVEGETFHKPSLGTRSSSHQTTTSRFTAHHSISDAGNQKRPYQAEWMITATNLLHVPDYHKLIQFVNGVTPSEEHFIAHRFIRGIAYFKIGKLNQAMKDLHESETRALESCEMGALQMTQLEDCTCDIPGTNCQSRYPERRGDVSLCNVYLGDLHYTHVSYLEASKCYQKATEYYDSENVSRLFRMVPPSLSSIHSKCGSCFKMLSKSMQAISEYKLAIETAVKDKDRLTAYTSLGNLYQSLGQNKEALPQYEEALILAEKLHDHMSVGWTHGNLGNAYLGLYEKHKALFHLQKSLDITIQYEPKPESIGRAYNNLGTAYQSLGDLDKAEEYYDLSLSQAIYGNDSAGQARVYGNIGNIFIIRKNFERAIPHYTEVLRLSKDETTITTAQHNRGCACYEWAESKMAALEKAVGQSQPGRNALPIFRIHGSKVTLPQNHGPRIVIDSIAKLYREGMEDLQKVVTTHEKKLDHIKGSPKGLSLSVSLTESNSRTFHRLQDCMVTLGNWRDALLIAEQSRARTLGEMMLARKRSQLEYSLTSPMNLQHVFTIVSSQNSPVLYLSHTGSSLLGWMMVPAPDTDSISMELFEIPLADDQFDGKSLDYHLRYGLTEVLVENRFEMYCNIDYNEESTAPVAKLFELIGRPLNMVLDHIAIKKEKMQKIILITDTYTTLMPFTCLYDSESKTFLSDHFYFETMPSLLTMGIMSQLPDPVFELPTDPHNMCIVGNPTIPQFYHNNEVWSLGKLPFAKREAQWVGHILNTPPILDEQATKNAVLMRFMRAKIIHIATHGSSVSGFLAFAALSSTRQGEVLDSSGVLLHPEEVEKLSISPALVVLSSCDSSRGTVKADGIQGMARAFILAGAQAVLTALWKVPDESAAVFMRFFYRFLEEGFESSLALQKSILSLRCFSKYSQYIHWSGYQLTGRSIRLDTKISPAAKILDCTMSPSSPFPRLMLVKKLESVLVDNPRLPTDIQILHGSPGVKPSEIAIDFIHSYQEKFAAGIFWICCRTSDLITASMESIEKTIGKPLSKLRLSDTQQALFILDNANELPETDQLLKVLKHTNVHIIILSKTTDPPHTLIKEADKALIRGCTIHNVKTLSTIDSTQRIVHEVFKEHYLRANNADQAVFENLAEFTSGSPLIVDIASKVLCKYIAENPDEPSEGLKKFADSIELSRSRKQDIGRELVASCISDSRAPLQSFQIRSISEKLMHMMPEVATIPPDHSDVWESNSEYDSWDSLSVLLNCCVSTLGELLLLRSLAVFGCCPIPISLVTTMSSLIAESSGHSHLGGIMHERLMESKVILKYPQPVVLHSSFLKPESTPTNTMYIYVPRHLASQLWLCDTYHQTMAIALCYKALHTLCGTEKNFEVLQFCLGLVPLLEEKASFLTHANETGKKCYERVYELYLHLSHKLHNNSLHKHIQ